MSSSDTRHTPFRSDQAKAGAQMPDARLALTVEFAYSVLLFLVDTWAGMGSFALIALVLGACMRVDAGRVLRSLVPLYFILIVTVLAHIPTGILTGLFYACRILLLGIITMIVAFSYGDSQFVHAFSSIFGPLRRLRVPVDDVATMFSVALRFIPQCMDEFRRVLVAQRSRGANLGSGGPIARLRCYANAFVPVIVGLFRRAESLSQAMEARAYGAARRTSLHEHSVSPSQLVVTVALVALIVLLAAFL